MLSLDLLLSGFLATERGTSDIAERLLRVLNNVLIFSYNVITTSYLTSTASGSASSGLDVSMATSKGDLPCGWGGGLFPW